MIDGTLDGGALIVICWSVAALSLAAKKISELPSGDHAGDQERPVRVTSRTISPVAALRMTTSLPSCRCVLQQPNAHLGSPPAQCSHVHRTERRGPKGCRSR